MEGLCAETMDEFRDTDAAVKQVIQAMQNQAASLEQAYESLRGALDASREKLATMNDLLCTEDNAE
jgi:exonuclease VII small subunit